MKTLSTDKTRSVLLVARTGELLPDAISRGLQDERVSCGWMRASGVLRDIELRAHSPELGGLAKSRRIAGPVHVLSLEGSIGLSQGEISFGTRAVIARETDRGLEVLAGEIVEATIVALEVHVTALDEIAVPRALDRDAGVWLFDATSVGTERAIGHDFEEAPARAPAPTTYRAAAAAATASANAAAASAGFTPRSEPDTPSGWGDAIAASAVAESTPGSRARSASSASGNPSPARPVRPAATTDDTPFPEAGDVVQHFAFGRADVIKSDGDRLHLRVHKDGRIREIALQMLKVSELGVTTEGKRSFRLDRKL